MMRRKLAYKRMEEVLLKDEAGLSKVSLDLLKNDVTNTLSRYMKVSDMYIHFTKLQGTGYDIKIEFVGDNIRVPKVLP